jgi:hypothetical protein
MKKPILILSAFLLFLTLPSAAQDFIAEVQAFLEKNVDSKGMVNYKGIANDPAELESIVEMISGTDLAQMEGNTKKAFLINTYNILVIKGITDHYPTSSPLDIDGFFKEITYSVDGQELTLSDLEKEVIMEEFPDARLHFALVCAAKGCPPLKNWAYHPNKLENELESVTKAAINNKSFVSTSSFPPLAKLSMIFDWYAADFKRDGGSVLGYINTFRTVDVPTSYKMVYVDYDWSLNAQ